jgi:predicted RNA methylase
MKLKELESWLQQMETFAEPKLHYEQYITTPHLASQILFNIDQMYDDLHEKFVCDLGCGTGMLGIGASLFEPNYVLGVDIDRDALTICQRNIDSFEVERIDLVQADCKQLLVKFDENHEDQSKHRLIGQFDTVVMNPPFGTKNQKIANTSSADESTKQLGADLIFLKLAAKLSTHSIYSIHKSVTRSYIKNLAKSWGLSVEVVSQLRYNIPKVESRNKRLAVSAPDKDIEVDLLRFVHL